MDNRNKPDPANILLAFFLAAFLVAAMAALVTVIEWTPVTGARIHVVASGVVGNGPLR
jgi:hypothetical protein